MQKIRLVPVGKIIKTHGILGGVKIFPYGESLSAQEVGAKLFLQSASKSKFSDLTIVKLSRHGKLLLAELQELTSMNEAQAVVGEEVFLPRHLLPPTAEGEYYHYQLIGLRVETREGKHLGTLRGIIETPGNDVYAVECEGEEILVPAVDEVILQIDLEYGRMVIDPPEGLIDDL